jgi:hypothetical protein
MLTFDFPLSIILVGALFLLCSPFLSLLMFKKRAWLPIVFVFWYVYVVNFGIHLATVQAFHQFHVQNKELRNTATDQELMQAEFEFSDKPVWIVKKVTVGEEEIILKYPVLELWIVNLCSMMGPLIIASGVSIIWLLLPRKWSLRIRGSGAPAI